MNFRPIGKRYLHVKKGNLIMEKVIWVRSNEKTLVAKENDGLDIAIEYSLLIAYNIVRK